MGDSAEDSERKHWFNVMRSFNCYSDFLNFDVKRREDHLRRLSREHLARLPPISFSKLNQIRNAGKENQKLFDDLIAYQYNHFFDFAKPPTKFDGERIPFSQMHRLQAVLHSLMREWSSSGEEERNQCFLPILNQLATYLPVNNSSDLSLNNYYKQKVLVPGCGVGRLPIEIASRGYCCQGNEFSVYMILASNFMLNCVSDNAEAYSIYPWLDKICNVMDAKDPLVSVKIPDKPSNKILEQFVSGTTALSDAELPFPKFSFAAGDFVELFGNHDQESEWNGIVTCFFIDTAPNIIRYVETIYNLLKPGGVWVNMGPLLYHWVGEEQQSAEQSHAHSKSKKQKQKHSHDHNEDSGSCDSRYAESIELSFEEVKHIILSFGFEFKYEEKLKECYYSSDKLSMMTTVYRTVLFTAVKK